MPRERLTVNEAVDRLVTAFDCRGWREDGQTAITVARAAAEAAEVDAESLAAAVKPRFLLTNGIDRAALEAVIASALSNVIVVSSSMPPPITKGDTHITVTNTGTLIGTFGDGIVSDVQVHQQQVMGDDAIRALVGEFSERPNVREVIDADLPAAEKRSRLASIVSAGRDFASDTIAKIVTGLLTPS